MLTENNTWQKARNGAGCRGEGRPALIITMNCLHITILLHHMTLLRLKLNK